MRSLQDHIRFMGNLFLLFVCLWVSLTYIILSDATISIFFDIAISDILTPQYRIGRYISAIFKKNLTNIKTLNLMLGLMLGYIRFLLLNLTNKV